MKATYLNENYRVVAADFKPYAYKDANGGKDYATALLVDGKFLRSSKYNAAAEKYALLSSQQKAVVAIVFSQIATGKPIDISREFSPDVQLAYTAALKASGLDSSYETSCVINDCVHGSVKGKQSVYDVNGHPTSAEAMKSQSIVSFYMGQNLYAANRLFAALDLGATEFEKQLKVEPAPAPVLANPIDDVDNFFGAKLNQRKQPSAFSNFNITHPGGFR